MRDQNRQLLEYQTFHREMAASWEALGEGGPTLAALAALCARTLAESWETGAATRTVEPNALSDERRPFSSWLKPAV